jgi:hypothetical protein
VTGFDSPTKLAFEVIAGPARPTGVFELSEPAPGQTRVRFALDLEAKGLAKLAGPMIAKQMQAEVGCLGRLKELLEA